MIGKREFQGAWIPASVWDHPKLSWFEKCLIAEIDSLSGPEHGPCNASSEYLAERMASSPGSIRNILSKLTQGGFLLQLGSDGRTTWRCVAPIYTGNCGKFLAWIEDRRCNPQVIDAVTSALQRLSPPGYTETYRENASENLRSSHRAALSEKNSERNGFSQAKKEKKQRLTLESVLDAVRPDLTLQSPSFVDAWTRWVENRLCLPKPTLGAFQMHMAKCAVLGERRAIDAIDHSIGASYLSIFEPKLQPTQNKRSESCL